MFEPSVSPCWGLRKSFSDFVDSTRRYYFTFVFPYPTENPAYESTVGDVS